MKKVLKQTLSVLLAVVMTFTITLPAFAEENAQTETEQDVSYNGTNAIGDVVINAMNESGETIDNESGINYFIQDVEIDELTATVELYAPDETTLLVAIYDEDSGVMTTSGKVDVDSNTETATVELAECEMPEFFIVKAFLLDNENAPVCNNYESIKYTADFQDFLAKTVFDFDEEKVINLDYGYESNFAVVSDDAQIVNANEDENIVVVDDYENGIYVFENANEEITSLAVGDVFYYVYGDGTEDYILTKVGTIENDNGTVTITAADDFEISALFSYIKIDTEQAVYEKPQTFAMARSFDDEAGKEDDFSDEFSFSLTKEFEIDENFKVSFSGALKAKFYLQFYYDFNLFKEDYYEITQSLTISATGETTISAAAKKELEPLVLFHGGIPIYAGIEAEVTFSLKFVFSAEISATGTLEVSLVNGSRKVAGRADENISKKPSVDIKLDISGKVAFDVIPSVSVGFKILKVIKVEMGVEANFKIEGVINILDLNSGESILLPDDKHFCDICIDGTITLSCTGFISVSFGLNKEKQKTVLKINLFSASTTLGDFYISIEKEDGLVKNIDFGFGRCPHIEYKVIFKAIDDLFNPLPNVRISINDMNFLTDADGQTVCYLNDGTYSCIASLDDYEINNDIYTFDKVYFAVHGNPVEVYIYMKKSNSNSGDSGNDNTGTDGIKTVIDSGSCGNDLTWTLYDDGELVIDGSGAMEDYSTSVSAPWDVYNSTITGVTIRDGVTTIGYFAFRKCSNLVRLTISDSVTSIGNHAFYGCRSLTSVTIGDSVTTIGYYAFRSCANLEFITIGDNATSIGRHAFTDTKYFDDWSNWENNVLYINNHLIIAKSEITGAYEIKQGTKTISEYAFQDCDNLESVTIPDSVTKINEYAFDDCDSLVNVTLGNSVKTIGERAFTYSNIESITIPDGLTTIGDHAFLGCTSLANITIPDSVTTIGFSAFDSTEYYNDSSNWKNGVLYINNHLIAAQDTITGSYEIKHGTITIGAGAFWACSSLTNVIIPDSVKTIGADAFYWCTGLTDITIPDSVKTIGYGAFYCCQKLENISISKSVIEIDFSAFEGCNRLTNVYYAGTRDEWNSISINSSGNENLTNANIICNAAVVPVLFMSFSLRDEPATCLESSVVSEVVTSAVLGNCYVILVVKDAVAEDLLSAENLLYIDQKLAESETFVFDFYLNGETDYVVIITNAEPNHSHKYTAVVTAPTCTEQGFTTYTCSCGDTYIDDYVDSTGHTDEIIPGYAATCTQTGLTDGVKCSVCGTITTEQKTIPVVSHNEGNHDGLCDACDFDFTNGCSHTCHSDNAFMQFLWRIISFLQKLFGNKSAQYCDCGVAHW